jgi:hypothetical protein
MLDSFAIQQRRDNMVCLTKFSASGVDVIPEVWIGEALILVDKSLNRH